MRILILGSNSFTARYFINLCLNKKKKIFCISRSKQYDKFFLLDKLKKNIFQQADLNNDLSLIKKKIINFNPDYIVNYAAQGEVRNSWLYPEDWLQTNLISSSKLLSFLLTYKNLKKFINISTPEVYGSVKNNLKENNFYNPSTPYALSKLAFDLNLELNFKKYKFPYLITRSSNVYGPYQQLYRIIPKAIILFKMGKKITLHNNGETLRDFIHAEDVANFTYACLSKGSIGETYHCSTPNKPISLKKIIKIICKIMDKNFNKNVLLDKENYGQDLCYHLDSSKSKKKLGWIAKISLRDGILQTIKWINKNWKYIKKSNLDYEHKK